MATSSSSFLDAYESLDVIGNGSFGIIRKVRRKSDGVIFARKELNFEKMSERDRKQIVAEVNILKDLHHDHIVRYHDRFVDRDAGFLYILMEYCGGGDLSTVIKQSAKQNRPMPEDTIWNYFYQLLQALHHCHHPNTHQRSGSGSAGNSPPADWEGNSRRAQILHRDLKPDNVFLDENNTVKLGDFGLSKALAQASFANTYVGTPYYMSPELMQEKAYDSKSDIWSLGCLIYELCALKPPFHEAKTHSELSIFIRNGRIPPLPRGYSQALTSVIKSMLNLNPAMRPSAAQLLQHERIDTIHKVAEAAKMLEITKGHRAAVANRERDVTAREEALREKEHRLAALLNQKDQEIASLHQLVSQLQQTHTYSQQELELNIRQAVGRREDELRILVTKREDEVADAMSKREEEIMEAVRRREVEVCQAWIKREEEIRREVGANCKAVEERMEWIMKRETELQDEANRLEEIRFQFEERGKKSELGNAKTRRDKNPLEEVKNTLRPHSRAVDATPGQYGRRKCDPQPTPRPEPTPIRIAALETPMTRPTYDDIIPSAMKGVVLTSTGETLATPAPVELARLFDSSPKVGLNFAKIFDFDDGEQRAEDTHEDDDGDHSPPPSPSTRKEKEKAKERDNNDDSSESSGSSTSTATPLTVQPSAPPTRIRRPSIRSKNRSTHGRSATLPSSVSEPIMSTSSSGSHGPKPLPHPHLRPSSSNSNLASIARATLPIPVPRNHPSPEYDFADEENLPSPFLKRMDKAPLPKNSTTSSTTGTSVNGSLKMKRSSGLLLRAVAAANNAGRRKQDHEAMTSPSEFDSPDNSRPSLASARKASEEARKALSRP